MLGACVICGADTLNDESICDAPDCRDEYEYAMNEGYSPEDSLMYMADCQPEESYFRVDR